MDNTSLSLWSLVLGASLIVKLVLLILLAGSIWSWGIMLKRRQLLKVSQQQLTHFEKRFWSGTDLTALHEEQEKHKQLTGIAAIFQAGFGAFLRVSATKMHETQMIEDVQRAMHVAFVRESDMLEEDLGVLATLGSVSPYIGLFGTVWGIMSAFIALSGVEQATLSMVAPGIAEALIATAMGLFVAIPAVIAYNRFNSKIERLLNEYENFQDEFVSILCREVKGAGK